MRYVIFPRSSNQRVAMLHLIVNILLLRAFLCMVYVDPDPMDSVIAITMGGKYVSIEEFTPCHLDLDYVSTVETGCMESVYPEYSFTFREESNIYSYQERGKPLAFITSEELTGMESFIVERTQLVTRGEILNHITKNMFNCPESDVRLSTLPKPVLPPIDNDTVNELAYMAEEQLASDYNAANGSNSTEYNVTEPIVEPYINETIVQTEKLYVSKPIGGVVCNLNTYQCFEDVYSGPEGSCIQVDTKEPSRAIRYYSPGELKYLINYVRFKAKVADPVIGIPVTSFFTGINIFPKDEGTEIPESTRGKRSLFLLIAILILEAIAFPLAYKAYQRIQNTMDGADAGFQASDRFYESAGTTINKLKLETLESLKRRTTSINGRRRLINELRRTSFIQDLYRTEYFRTRKNAVMALKISNYLMYSQIPVDCAQPMTPEEKYEGYKNKLGFWLTGIYCSYILTKDPQTVTVPEPLKGLWYYYNGHNIQNVSDPIITMDTCGIFSRRSDDHVLKLTFETAVSYLDDARFLHENWCKSPEYKPDSVLIPPLVETFELKDPATKELILYEALCSYCVGNSNHIGRIPKGLLDVLAFPYKIPGLVGKVIAFAVGKLVDLAVGILSFLFDWKWALLLLLLIGANAIAGVVTFFGSRKLLSLG